MCLIIYALIFNILSITLREECTLGVFENRVLIRIFWPKRDKVTGEWRRLHNEEFYEVYSPNIIQMILQEECDERDM